MCHLGTWTHSLWLQLPVLFHLSYLNDTPANSMTPRLCGICAILEIICICISLMWWRLIISSNPKDVLVALSPWAQFSVFLICVIFLLNFSGIDFSIFSPFPHKYRIFGSKVGLRTKRGCSCGGLYPFENIFFVW